MNKSKYIVYKTNIYNNTEINFPLTSFSLKPICTNKHLCFLKYNIYNDKLNINKSINIYIALSQWNNSLWNQFFKAELIAFNYIISPNTLTLFIQNYLLNYLIELVHINVHAIAWKLTDRFYIIKNSNNGNVNHQHDLTLLAIRRK